MDVGRYIEEHPGGSQLLLNHAVSPLLDHVESDDETSSLDQTPASSTLDSGYFSGGHDDVKLKDATKVFFGGMNNHSGAAKEKMRCLRVARLG